MRASRISWKRRGWWRSPVQYARYLGRVLRGNLGRSYAQKIEVTDLLRSRLAATFWLMLGGIAFELLIGLPAGMMSALRRRSAVDSSVMLGAFLGVSAPQFVVGLFLLYWLADRWGLFPLGGYGPPPPGVPPACSPGSGG